MYNVHQDATYLPLDLTCERKAVRDDRVVPMVSATASRDKDGVIHISLSNIDLKESQDIELSLGDVKVKSISGRILTSDNISDYNSYDNPNKVAPKAFNGAKVNKGNLKITLPAKSIVTLEVK
jgi:alpha-N-arabinofuranosidase